MACPLCNVRKPRRECPAIRQTICPVCCGTKRLTEIDCPADCVHLAAAREHPPAVIKRQQERDIVTVLPTIRHLSERQHQLFFLFHSVIARHVPDGLARLVDDDVADAAGALAATLETSSRGVIYEHAPKSLPAQKLASELKGLLGAMEQEGARVYDTEAAVTLRAIEAGARQTPAGASGETSYLDLMRRLLGARNGGSARSSDVRPAPSLILP
jgi:hypothetical protein